LFASLFRFLEENGRGFFLASSLLDAFAGPGDAGYFA